MLHVCLYLSVIHWQCHTPTKEYILYVYVYAYVPLLILLHVPPNHPHNSQIIPEDN